ncbi:MAG: FHA domain-containing protein [Planctomycetes bacterium]|nr:FHA domain-containing protein [Planctomycetota bacterium]
MNFRLLIAGAEGLVPVSLQGTQWIFGRAPESDIRLDDPLVSRKHAILQFRQGALHIRDIAAKNPTRVNGLVIAGEAEVNFGDTLTIGSTLIEVHQPTDLRMRLRNTKSDDGTVETFYVSHFADERVDESLRLLDEVATSLRPVHRSEDAAQLLIGLVHKVVPVRRAIVARIGPGETLRVIAAANEDTDTDPIDVTRRMLSLLREQRSLVCVRDASTIVEIAAPLFTEGRLTGLIYLKPDRKARWNERELTLVQCLSRILSARLETIGQIENLEATHRATRVDTRVTARFVGNAASIQTLQRRAAMHCFRSHGAVICGETGSGKLAFARFLHAKANEERETPASFVAIDGAVASALEFRELLRDSATPDSSRGPLADAIGGTLCLHHVTQIPHEVQELIANELATDTERRTRLVVTHTGSATEIFESLHPRLAELLSRDDFDIPPLRQRVDDIHLLANYFLDEAARDFRIPVATMSPRANDRLGTYDWPGNVEELRRTIQTAAILAGGRVISPKHLPKSVTAAAAEGRSPDIPTLEDVERDHIRHVLEIVGGNKVLASKALGIANSTLYQKMKKFGIQG